MASLKRDILNIRNLVNSGVYIVQSLGEMLHGNAHGRIFANLWENIDLIHFEVIVLNILKSF